MKLKGDYTPGTKYEIGDVVRASGMAFILNKEENGKPGMDDCWGRLSQEMWDVVDLILSAVMQSEDAIVLRGTEDPTKEYLVSIDDSGLTPELAVDLIEGEAK